LVNNCYLILKGYGAYCKGGIAFAMHSRPDSIAAKVNEPNEWRLVGIATPGEGEQCAEGRVKSWYRNSSFQLK